MRLRTKQIIASAVTALALAGTIIFATSAPAQANYADCQPGQFCTYWDITGGGAEYYYTGPIGTCIEVGAPWDNNISSVYNRTSHVISVFDGHFCNGLTGIPPLINPGDSLSYSWPKNDSISSIYIRP